MKLKNPAKIIKKNTQNSNKITNNYQYFLRMLFIAYFCRAIFAKIDESYIYNFLLKAEIK